MTKIAAVMGLTAEITQAKKKLADLLKKLEELLDGQGDSDYVETQRRCSYAYMIMLHFNGRPVSDVSSEDELLTACSVPFDKRPSFRGALSRLVKSGKLVKPGRKLYQRLYELQS